MTTDADAYRRLTTALGNRRGDDEAYRRLGAQMTARRHLLGPRYGNRRLFVRERLLPLGLKESAAYKLVYDLESGKLQGRGGFSAGNMLVLAEAYAVTPESVADALDGGDLVPVPSPAPAPAPAPPEGYPAAAAPGVEERLPRFADQVWTEVLAAQMAHRVAADLLAGAQVFGDGTDDAAIWDAYRDLSLAWRVRTVALARATREAAGARAAGNPAAGL